MLAIYNWQKLSGEEKQKKLARAPASQQFKSQVKAIIEAVKKRGDQALFDFSREFDGVDLKSLKVPAEKISKAQIDKPAMEALQAAIQTISSYHQATLPTPVEITTAPGIKIKRLYHPISKVGLYIPGGNKTPLVSSVLMQAIPALITGCPQRILCTPPNAQGEIDPHILVAARLCEIDSIYQIGGAQAIAAMAYGTESVPKMDKLFGPGNSYVTEAKTQVASDPAGAAIDMPAGPSELMITADNQANPDFVAADLLAQAEHGVDSQVILLCESEAFATQVNQALQQQLKTLSRQTIIQKALEQSSIIICDKAAEQIEIINAYAPEHLIINRENAKAWVQDIVSAGTIFLGQWAAETMGDYVTGSNHVLPTNGYARNHSGLGSLDFLKALSVQSISSEGLKTLGKAAETLAGIEGLDAHAKAISLRLTTLES